MDIKPIHTEADHQATLEEIERLMELDPQPGTPEEARLDILATLVAAYEDEHCAIPLPDPIAAIEYYMESREVTRKDLEKYIGRRGRVSEILNRQRPLTINMIRKLHQELGIPAEILVQPYECRKAAA